MIFIFKEITISLYGGEELKFYEELYCKINLRVNFMFLEFVPQRKTLFLLYV